MFSEDKTNIFISYSWDNEGHKKWVLELSKFLNAAGFNSVTDKNLQYGGHFRSFMERGIKASDVVLMIFTPNYKYKAEALKDGVGYEYNIITKNLFEVIKSNEKYIGVLREGDYDVSVPEFSKDFKCLDLRNDENYENNLKELINQIAKEPLKKPEVKLNGGKTMDITYKDLDRLLPELEQKTEEYFNKIFNDNNDNSVAAKLVKAKIVSTFNSWKVEIKDYSEKVKEKFSSEKLAIYEDILEDFKTKIFRNTLWTVNAALKTPDPDLARYKKDFSDAMPDEILETIKRVLEASESYISKTACKIDYEALKNVQELRMEYLDSEKMFMNKVIGYGIRSELLHRYYPAHFAIMTQKSLWALYFMGDSAKEFITIEQKTRKGIMRVSHNWQYPYDRFTFITNILTKKLEELFSKYECEFSKELWFGYTNMFLSEIHKYHREEIKILHKWEPIK